MRHRKLPTWDWIACNSLADGAETTSVIRECRTPGCGTQVWVNMFELPKVEAGTHRPRCWDCQADSGDLVTLTDEAITYLRGIGQLERGWRRVAEINAWITSCCAADEADDQQDEPDNGQDQADHVGNGGERVGE